MDRIDKVENKIDVILEKIHSIDKTLERNTASLELHMKRSDALEKKLEPVERHVTIIQGLAGLAGILATVLGVLKLLNLI